MSGFDRNALLADLKREEGFRPYAYFDTANLLTIGYGRLCDKSRKGSGLTEAEASTLLDNDVARVEAQLTAALPWLTSLSDARQRVLLEMAFQLGVNGVLAFRKAIAAVKAGQWQEAHDEMLDSAWHTQTKERAERLAEQMLRG